MKHVVGIDLGTSAVKVVVLNEEGEVVTTVSREYPLIQDKSGYSEQDPDQWVEKTLEALAEVAEAFDGYIEGMSFSGQMHGLVLLDEQRSVLRPAILWNDTRTTKQCVEIDEQLGDGTLRGITKNAALEGFTLPKLLWVKENEPEIFAGSDVFMLPKDYLRFKLTGEVYSDFSDAAGTLLLDVEKKEWSKEILDTFQIPMNLCPPLLESTAEAGTLTPSIARKTGLSEGVKVFAGGADNACGAVGSGILTEGDVMCSIGTSGVVLAYEEGVPSSPDLHGFNHAKEGAHYSMGVTLSAGFSLTWFKDTFGKEETFDALLKDIELSPPGSNGLLFTPYLFGERTPHASSTIRASFIGMDASHEKRDFARAVIEGITFSLAESVEILRKQGKNISKIIAIGGGAKNETWLQIQADIFNAEIVSLSNEQGPGAGAAMLAAYGCRWFSSLEDCTQQWVHSLNSYKPVSENVEQYQELFGIYKRIYHQTKEMNEELAAFER